MKILVTGANGYIGSKLVTRLLDMGNEVIATDLNNNHIDTRANFIKANIFDENINFFELFNKPDVCIHLAWRDGFVHNSINHIIDLPKHFFFIKKLIDNGLKHVAVMGSMHEIGYYEGSIDENTPCHPQTYYGIAKNSLREMIQTYTQEKGCVFQWLRGFYIYGSDLFGNSIFAKIKKASLDGKKYFPFTTGKNKFDFISVEELCMQISYVITQKYITGIINICSGKPVSLGKQVEWYIKKNNLDIQLEYGKFKERTTESPCIYGNNIKIQKIIEQKNKKILVTGAKGQLGYDCERELRERGYINIKGIDVDDLDLTNELNVKNFLKEYKPDIIIHNAAWTSVDKAEKYPLEVYKINSLAPKYLAEASKLLNAKMVYISTDYVFSGEGTEPFNIDDEKKGLSVYGRTKSKGEDFVKEILDKYFIVRISWAFGKNGNNFVKTMLKLAAEGEKEINVVNDQIGSITYTYDLSKLLCDMIETEKYGTYHATNEGFISWADFAKEIFKIKGLDVNVNPLTSQEYLKLVPNQAIRPLNSRMSKVSLDKAGFNRLPNWNDALNRYLNEIN